MPIVQVEIKSVVSKQRAGAKSDRLSGRNHRGDALTKQILQINKAMSPMRVAGSRSQKPVLAAIGALPLRSRGCTVEP
jgi:hypothetical protein